MYVGGVSRFGQLYMSLVEVIVVEVVIKVVVSNGFGC